MWKDAGNKCPHLNGAYYKSTKDALHKMLENKAVRFAQDQSVNHAPTKSAETTAKGRYKRGFEEIIDNHVKTQTTEQQVIVLVSHSDGINPFLALFGANKIDDPCYCCTIAVELEINPNTGSVQLREESGVTVIQQ